MNRVTIPKRTFLLLLSAVLWLSLLAACGPRRAGRREVTRPRPPLTTQTTNSLASGSGPTVRPTLQPPTPTVLARAISTPLNSQEPGQPVVQIQTGFLAHPVTVYLQPDPDAEVLGELQEGRLLIITGSRDGWYEIVYGGARSGHAWVRRSAVALATPTPYAVGVTPAGSEATVNATELPTQVPPAPSTISPTPQPQGGTVLAVRLNVRSGPGTDYPILGQLQRKDRVQVLERRQGWLRILYPTGPEGSAWVSAAYVALDGEPTPVRSTASSLPGKLVFQDRNGGTIYIMNANGTGLRELTHGFEPALSPDGRQIAFTRWENPRGLWVINVDGSNERRLTGAERARSPTWAPDGRAIVFERATSSIRCYSTPFGCLSEAEARQRFGDDGCLDTPAGRICLSDFPLITRWLTGLTRYDLTDGSLRDLPASQTAAAPRYSPMGDHVLYLDRDGLAVAAAAGNEPPQRLVEEPAFLGPAVYSPDGRFIYASRRSGDTWNIWRWRSDGSQPLALTTPPALRSGPVHNVAPAVSPDGRHIVFFTNRRGRWELWVMEADGSNQRPLSGQGLSDISFDYTFASERMIDWGP